MYDSPPPTHHWPSANNTYEPPLSQEELRKLREMIGSKQETQPPSFQTQTGWPTSQEILYKFPSIWGSKVEL